MVRSVVSDAGCATSSTAGTLDVDHLAWAIDVLKAEKGWRSGARPTPLTPFLSVRRRDRYVDAAVKSDGFKELAADYDRTWPAGVTRTRDILTMVEERDQTLSLVPRGSGDPALER